MPNTLTALRAAADAAYHLFLASVETVAAGVTEYDWYRALPDSGTTRKNDDRRNDAALAGSAAIRAAHDAYIRELHAYYLARDGEGGFLGRLAA